jgi:hypothetical protein
MHLNDYELQVILGNNEPASPRPPAEDGDGYVDIGHQTIYKLRLRNTHPTRCDVEVVIDNERVGTWRIGAWQTIVIERPAATPELFVALLLNSADGVDARLGDVSRRELGLVQATFKPERAHQVVSNTLYTVQSSTTERTPDPNLDTYKGMDDTMAVSYGGVQARQAAAVGTGLIGHSNQTFTNVADLDYDIGHETIITLRLVDKGGTINTVRPVRPLRQNPVPPPVR